MLIKSNLIQYNEYYPFGMNTANSWTRENTTGNNFLGNGGTEFNNTSNLYDLDYRNYDPILGRMNGVDPMATKYASSSPYNFSFNDPVTFNDPSGADADPLAYWKLIARWVDRNNTRTTQNARYTRGVVGDDDLIYGNSFESYGPGGINSLGGPAYDPVTKKYYTQDFKNGVFGLYIKRAFIDYSTENIPEGMLASIMQYYEWHEGSLNHYRTMSNRVVQRMHEGSREFAAHPFGGGLLAFVSGGGLFGAGGGALARLGAKQLLQNGARAATRLGTPIFNATKSYASTITRGSFATNTVLSISSQLIIKQDVSKIDYADALISGISGRGLAQVGGGLLSGLVDLSFEKGFVNGFNKNGYQLGADMATGVITGGLGIGISNLPISNEWINAGGFFNTMIGDGFNTVLTGN